MTVLSLTLWGITIYKLKLISKYLSIIHKKHCVKEDFSLVHEKLLNWKASSLLSFYKYCAPLSVRPVSWMLLNSSQGWVSRKEYTALSVFCEDLSISLRSLCLTYISVVSLYTLVPQCSEMYLQVLPILVACGLGPCGQLFAGSSPTI